MILPGTTPESVEGMVDSWLIYRMKATIERGILQRNILARKQVRLIRTLDLGALEFAHAMVKVKQEGNWNPSLTSIRPWKTFGQTRSYIRLAHLERL